MRAVTSSAAPWICIALILLPHTAQAQEPEANAVGLETLRERALAQKNVRVEVLEARIAQSAAFRRQVRADLLPTAQLTAAGIRNNQQIEIGDRVFQPLYDWNARVGGSVVLFDGTLYPAYERAKVLEHAVRAQADWELQILASRVEQAALVAMARARDVEIARQAIALREEDVARARALVEVQSAVPLDVARAEALLLQARRALLDAEVARDDARAAVLVLLGEDPAGELVLADELEAYANEALAAPRQGPLMLEERADLVAIDRGVEATELQADSTWWTLMPSLSVALDSRFGPATVGNPNGFAWALSLNLSWLLYDGGRRNARLEELEQVSREQSATRRVVELEARDAILALERVLDTSAARIEVAREQLGVAERALELARQRFDAGLTTTIEIRDASDDLYAAQLDLNQTLLAAALARAQRDYLLALGEPAR